ncbi:hypothetical protein [uncultured Sunxiuqinia sp.]|uniref:hypothetical protein n=1 Tax=uncultured Sunxiuqinia sp. TaxID=1573825 RepID=UPI00260C5A30|nr:hypothetical protein [uncultured Sunxiuqinia sp.]
MVFNLEFAMQQKPLSSFKLWLNILILIFLVSCYKEDDYPSPINYIIEGPQDQFPAFSPDGEHIAYYHFAWGNSGDYPTGLYIIDKNGGNRKLVLRGDHFSPSWSPDGQWLVFSSGGVIQKCKINGDSLTTFSGLNYLDNPEFYFPDWSSDGKYILFDKPLGDERGVYFTTHKFQNPNVIFGLNITSGRDPELSPNGNEFIYYDWMDGKTPSEIFKQDTDDKIKIRLTNNERDDRAPTWSPDGQMIAWSSSLRLCVMNVDGSNYREITYGKDPSWSVSDEIVFSHANADYSKEVLYIVNSDGTKQRQITF